MSTHLIVREIVPHQGLLTHNDQFPNNFINSFYVCSVDQNDTLFTSETSLFFKDNIFAIFSKSMFGFGFEADMS